MGDNVRMIYSAVGSVHVGGLVTLPMIDERFAPADCLPHNPVCIGTLSFDVPELYMCICVFILVHVRR